MDMEVVTLVPRRVVGGNTDEEDCTQSQGGFLGLDARDKESDQDGASGEGYDDGVTELGVGGFGTEEWINSHHISVGVGGMGGDGSFGPMGGYWQEDLGDILNMEEEVGEGKGEEEDDIGRMVGGQGEDHGVDIGGDGMEDQEDAQVHNILGEEEEIGMMEGVSGADERQGKEGQGQRQDSRRRCVSQAFMTAKIRFQGVYI